MPDVYELLGPEDEDVKRKAAAMAAALRDKETFGQLLQLGGRQFAPLGQSMAQSASAGEKEMVGALERRPAMLKAAMDAREKQAADAAWNTPEGEAAGRGLAGAWGVPQEVAAQMRGPMLREAIKSAPAMYRAQHPTTLPFALGADGTIIDKRTGATRPGAGQVGLSPESIRNRAMYFNQTGTHLPGLPRGRAAMPMLSAIENEAIKLKQQGVTGSEIAAAGADYKAGTKSIVDLTQTLGRVKAFEGMALSNLDRFLGTAKNVVDSGIPLVNKPLRQISDSLLGSPQMAQFRAARMAALTEIAKILSGALGNQVLSDSARHEVAALTSPDATLAQIVAAAEILKADMAARPLHLERQIAETKGRISGAASAPPPATPPAGGAPASDLKKKYGL